MLKIKILSHTEVPLTYTCTFLATYITYIIYIYILTHKYSHTQILTHICTHTQYFSSNLQMQEMKDSAEKLEAKLQYVNVYELLRLCSPYLTSFVSNMSMTLTSLTWQFQPGISAIQCEELILY